MFTQPTLLLIDQIPAMRDNNFVKFLPPKVLLGGEIAYWLKGLVPLKQAQKLFQIDSLNLLFALFAFAFAFVFALPLLDWIGLDLLVGIVSPRL